MPFTLERLQKISKSKSLPPRLEEEKKMRLIINETIKKFSQNCVCELLLLSRKQRFIISFDEQGIQCDEFQKFSTLWF
ncbi:hypothetical protein BpHYR1_010282 [Brachionus plicatilis]|uniref:Uncharacterized protein n=1 Tax=Brachionus plicatilis TaxID=10195 RepID=A0A3M7RC94_BRAPC|nr:hypothetical protein BpHYR1_010282 [Brachionus plicatilis]